MKKLFRLKYLGATNTRGVRMTITNVDTQEKWTLARDYALDYRAQAIKYIEEFITYGKHEYTFDDRGVEYMLFNCEE